ncbi:MAG: molybdopterin-dependent oxidoreductase [Sciscionella sp.]
MASEHRDGAPIGRRTVLGLLGLGAAGVLGGQWAQQGMAKVVSHDPTQLLSLLPLGDTFRFYSVTGSVPARTAATYRLRVSGLLTHAMTYTMADLAALPQTVLVRDFHCVTGWHVPQVHWSGVRLSVLLDQVAPSAGATAVRFFSFDGTYTENMTIEQARRGDVIVASRMLGGAITHDHGGPVRMYSGAMYGYKSTKWLSGIELTDRVVPGYWETRGYGLNGFIQP